MRTGLLILLPSTAAAALVTCSGDPPRAELVVDLRTDLSPGREFYSVVTSADNRSQVRLRVDRSFDFQAGLRVGEFRNLVPGTATIELTLLDANEQVVVTRTQSSLLREGVTSVTLVLTRDCIAMPSNPNCQTQTICPPGTQCEDSSVPPPSACSTDVDCDDGVVCTTDTCTGITCLNTPNHALCTDSPGGTCSPGTGCVYPVCQCDAADMEMEEQACGNCGLEQRTRSCTELCQWAPWSEWQVCTGEGVCASGGTEMQDADCGNCGTKPQLRTCDNACAWGEWSDTGACTGEGECAADAVASRMVGCGNCGEQEQQRTCDGECAWGAWGDVGGCTGEGVCSPGASQARNESCDCGKDCSGTRRCTRSCSSGCAWRSWSCGSCS